MRRFTLLAAAAVLVACSPPAPRQTEAPPAEPPVVVAACNSVTPDMTKPVRLGSEPVAVAALPPELPGGPIAPGAYDLISGNVADGAPEWSTDRFVALDVSESDAGVVFNYAAAAPGAETERWTASFHQGPPSQIEYTCGHEGTAAITFAASGNNELRLRMPDPSGTGAQVLLFVRRG
jgi:hypothetical protein